MRMNRTDKNFSENKLILKAVNRYLTKRFASSKSLAFLTEDDIISTRRNDHIDLYLRLRRMESLFPANCLIIARLGFEQERIGHGTDFVRFLTGIAVRYGFEYIGIESTNLKSATFAQKLGFEEINKSTNYAIPVSDLVEYFRNSPV